MRCILFSMPAATKPKGKPMRKAADRLTDEQIREVFEKAGLAGPGRGAVKKGLQRGKQSSPQTVYFIKLSSNTG
jgi:hypothetical protein